MHWLLTYFKILRNMWRITREIRQKKSIGTKKYEEKQSMPSNTLSLFLYEYKGKRRDVIYGMSMTHCLSIISTRKSRLHSCWNYCIMLHRYAWHQENGCKNNTKWNNDLSTWNYECRISYFLFGNKRHGNDNSLLVSSLLYVSEEQGTKY